MDTRRVARTAVLRIGQQIKALIHLSVAVLITAAASL
tara:strand:- start:86 stop:196 length:111 start_codon:yes stop_codon:yes gene_type:complete